MDRMLYVAATGAAHLERSQAVHANNLANANTNGFRSEFAETMARAVRGDGLEARNYGLTQAPGFDFAPGIIRETGQNLDVAVQGSGFLAVAMPDGREGYSRAGALSVDSAGRLLTPDGLPLLGGGGPVALPPYTNVYIAADGGITIRPEGQGPETLIQVDQLKLVNPEPGSLMKAAPGLFVAKPPEGADPDAVTVLEPDPEVTLVSGALESSNVSAVNELTEILSIARQFELEVKMMRKAEEIDESASQLVRIG
ncbi:MAG: flagellar basal body rod protein FlgF [Pseudomonadales bacterium]